MENKEIIKKKSKFTYSLFSINKFYFIHTHNIFYIMTSRTYLSKALTNFDISKPHNIFHITINLHSLTSNYHSCFRTILY